MHDLHDLVDPDSGSVSARIFTDEDIYEQEMLKIFGTSWLFLAHDSMLPKKGDYLSTSMGDDPVVVVRQKDGSVRAFLNQCRHRGMRLCRADGGNAKAFTCTYHGWTYDLSGNLTQVPHEEDAYGMKLDKERLGALAVPRIETYKGFIFGCWDENAMALPDYLGDMAWYLDSFVDRWENSEVAGAANRWIIDCNWKLPAEQFASDAYHAETSHVSALMSQENGWVEESAPGRQFSSPLGHGTGFFLDGAPDMTDYGSAVSDHWEQTRHQEIERLGELRAVNVRGHNTVYPNFSFLVGTNTMRVWHPRGPNSIEVMTWTLVDRDAPDEVKDAMRRNALRTFSSGGIFEAEDGENWAEIQQVLQGTRTRRSNFNYTMGLGESRQGEGELPGTISDIFSEEAGRGFYRRWLELMTAENEEALS